MGRLYLKKNPLLFGGSIYGICYLIWELLECLAKYNRNGLRSCVTKFHYLFDSIKRRHSMKMGRAEGKN